jgi:hypothetical protein
MPLVFVHGVNVRRGNKPDEQKQFDDEVATRDQNFRKISLAGLVPPNQSLHIENPYWGDFGAHFAYDLASVPAEKGTEVFGANDNRLIQVLAETVPLDVAKKTQATEGSESSLLLTLARDHSLSLAIDAVALATTVNKSSTTGDEGEFSAELAAFAAKALAYADKNQQSVKTWLNAINPATGELRLQNDSDFLETLIVKVNQAAVIEPGVESFGGNTILDWMKTAAQGLAQVASKTVSAITGAAAGALTGAVAGGALSGVPGTTLRVLRPLVTQRAGVFLGDAFVYLAQRGSREQPGDIIKTVIGAIEQAEQQKTATDNRLIVIAHSMGGNIIYDLLTHYRPDLKVDLFVTVGSQVAVFKELGLYKEDESFQSSTTPRPRIAKPQNVGAWMNVFDPLDVLGFAVEAVYEDTKDFAYSNEATVLNAHTLYFLRPKFHQRLRARMAEIGFGTPE